MTSENAALKLPVSLSSLTMRETDGTNKVLDLTGYLNDFVSMRFPFSACASD